MKKILAVILVLATLVFWGLAFAVDGVITQALEIFPNTNAAILTFSFQADAGAGTFAATPISAAITDKITGMYIIQVVTNPGGTAPTDDWDITITDADGLDVMGGTLLNRDTATTERAIPKIDTVNGIFGGAMIGGTLTLNITGNAVNAANGTIKVYMSR